MKKVFAALATTVLVPMTALAATSYVPGDYTTTLNLNIHSTPYAVGPLIGHYLMGQDVTVTKVLQNWCKVPYRNEPAYVYCKILTPKNATAAVTPIVPVMQTVPVAPAVPSTSTVSSSTAVTNNLMGLKQWFLATKAVNGGTGVDYINNSYLKAQTAAMVWDKSAVINDFTFQWSLPSSAQCKITFTGSAEAHKVFSSTCFDKNSAIQTVEQNVVTPAQSYALPMVNMRVFVDNLLADATLMEKLNAKFTHSQDVQVFFRLYRNVPGAILWQVKFVDSTGNFVTVWADANQVQGYTFQMK